MRTSWSAWGADLERNRILAALGLAITGAIGIALIVAPGSEPRVALVDPDDPAATLDRQITNVFGLASPVVWIIEPRAGTVWSPAMLARVQALTRDVFRIPGVVAPDVVSLASPNLRDLVVDEEGMRPVYLMGTVPETPEAVATLRARVDGDPMLRGQLVSLDGRAAMIVANFRTSADAGAIARDAIALRDRHRGPDADVWVVGAPVLAMLASRALPDVARRRIVPALALALAVFVGVVGWRRATAAGIASAVTVLASIGVTGRMGILVLPWTAIAVAGVAFAACALTVAGRIDWRAVLGGGAGTLGALAGAAWLAPGAERALAWGGIVAIPLAAVTIGTARLALRVDGTVRGRRLPALRGAAALAVVALATGVASLREDFALAGYPARYLPASIAPDVDALSRLFPPPQSLALRVRGEPGFVSSPDVLRAFGRITVSATADPVVRSATSLADLVAIVHRSFNDGRPEFALVPNDRGLVARYLALAYSPGFRRFVDRALADAAIWITIDAQATPRDLARIETLVDATLAAAPPPDAVVDRFGGDGAVTLAMAASARRTVVGGLGVLVATLLSVVVAAGPASARRALAVSTLMVAGVAGTLGWCGHALDLLTVPLLVATALAATIVAAAAPPAEP